MKTRIVIYLLAFSLNLVAQPDPKYATEHEFNALTALLKENPTDYNMIFNRVKLSDFNRSHSRRLDEWQDKDLLFPYKDPNLFLDDLNKLISSDFTFEAYNRAYFKMLRGRFYFNSGEKNKAISDYKSALNYIDSNNTTNHIKRELYISIADYYYHLDLIIKKDNARQVLNFIDLACPGIELYLSDDCFERERKELLNRLDETERLTRYYQDLILAELNDFMTGSTVYHYGQTMQHPEHYLRTLMRIYELVEFYKKNGNYKKSTSVKNRLIQFLPPDNNGEAYKKFPQNDFDYWMLEYEANIPVIDWINKNKTNVYNHYPELPAFVTSITSEE